MTNEEGVFTIEDNLDSISNSIDNWVDNRDNLDALRHCISPSNRQLISMPTCSSNGVSAPLLLLAKRE